MNENPNLSDIGAQYDDLLLAEDKDAVHQEEVEIDSDDLMSSLQAQKDQVVASQEALVQLEETVSSEKAERLAETILQHRNSNLNIDATNVTRVDTSCIEVLLSAAKLWTEDHCHLAVVNMSEEFINALSILGIDQSKLEAGDL